MGAEGIGSECTALAGAFSRPAGRGETARGPEGRAGAPGPRGETTKGGLKAPTAERRRGRNERDDTNPPPITERTWWNPNLHPSGRNRLPDHCCARNPLLTSYHPGGNTRNIGSGVDPDPTEVGRNPPPSPSEALPAVPGTLSLEQGPGGRPRRRRRPPRPCKGAISLAGIPGIGPCGGGGPVVLV